MLIAAVSWAAAAGLAVEGLAAGVGDAGALVAGGAGFLRALGSARAVGDGRPGGDGAAGLALAGMPSGASAPTGRGLAVFACGPLVPARMMTATRAPAPSRAVTPS